MSGHNDNKQGPDPYRIGDEGYWAKAWMIMATLGAVGLVGAVVGWLSDPHRFAFSYLFAFAVVMTVSLGGLFFVLVQYATAASWGITLRRTAEFIASPVSFVVLAILAIPVFANYHTLYEWSHVEHESHEVEPSEAVGGEHEEAAVPGLLGPSTAHAQAPEHAGDVGHPKGREHDTFAGMEMKAHTPMEEALHHELLEYKTETYLTTAFWGARSALYLLVWIVLGFLYFRWSTRQDETGDPELTVKAQKLAPIGLILFGLTLTFAGIDWIMSMEPTWYSTIYGVYLFAGSAMAILALIIVITSSMRSQGLLGDAVNVEHYHDLGKLMFGFVCFWAYVGFSQWMLIWYASIPEETTYYFRRWTSDGWQAVSLLLILGHFAAPFFFLISRVPKRKLGMLQAGAVWLLFIHVVDMYWFVMPYAPGGGLSIHWLDVACLLAVVGTFFAVVFFLMRKYPLVPLRDPRLSRALHFHQTQ